MPADLTKPFSESCCDGGQCSTAQSAQPCGCDLGANHICEHHKKQQELEVILDALNTGASFADDANCAQDLFERALKIAESWK